eukprot:5423288-Pyramimonas_sp.AAC.1
MEAGAAAKGKGRAYSPHRRWRAPVRTVDASGMRHGGAGASIATASGSASGRRSLPPPAPGNGN